jgi:hypothetical protein
VVADGSNGLLCDLAPEAFATGLRSVLGNPERLLAMRSASLAKAHEFSLSDRLDDYERVLDAVAP